MDVLVTYPDHPIYEEMVCSQPNGVRYRILGKRFRQDLSRRSRQHRPGRWIESLRGRCRDLCLRNARSLRWYQEAKWRAIDSQARRVGAGDIVHCCGHLYGGRQPWIGDYENVNVLSLYEPAPLKSCEYRSFLEAVFSSDSCRAVRLWSPAAMASFRQIFTSPSIQHKAKLLFPSMRPLVAGEFRPEQRGGDPPRLLFVGRGFWQKGGKLLLDAMIRLRKHFQFELDFICDVPDECSYYRRELEGTVRFFEPSFSRPELYARFYAKADIFVMLGMADSYGLALLEATAWRLPVIAFKLNSGLSDLLALTENSIQVSPKYQMFDSNGLHLCSPRDLVNSLRSDPQDKVVEALTEAFGTLLSDRQMRLALAEAGTQALNKAPLSFEFMRAELSRLYEESTT